MSALLPIRIHSSFLLMHLLVSVLRFWQFRDKSQDFLLKHQASINELKRTLREPNSKLTNREKCLSAMSPTATPEKKVVSGGRDEGVFNSYIAPRCFFFVKLQR